MMHNFTFTAINFIHICNMHLSMLSSNVKGGRAYVGHLIFSANFQSNAPPSGNKYWSNTHHFEINCNKYYIDKSHSFKLP